MVCVVPAIRHVRINSVVLFEILLAYKNSLLASDIDRYKRISMIHIYMSMHLGIENREKNRAEEMEREIDICFGTCIHSIKCFLLFRRKSGKLK